jgi:predicted methyltransferase
MEAKSLEPPGCLRCSFRDIHSYFQAIIEEKRKLKHRRSFAVPLALAAVALVVAVVGAATVVHQSAIPESQIPRYILDAVNSPDRPAADRELDASRKPAQILAFFGIRPGMKVADLWAGGGYTTELLARAVGPTGKVYSQNMQFPPKFKKAEEMWKNRVKEPGMSNVVEISRSFDSPDFLSVPAGSLDAVIMNMNYHDMVGRGFNRNNVNQAVFKALKPGGVYGLIDNSAKPGSGARDANTLHRIDEDFEVSEIEKAGFRLAADSDVLRNPSDPRTQPFWKVNHTQDRFVIKFVKS